MTKANRITRFMHCRACQKERPGKISAAKFARLEVGLTPDGLQIWCARHAREVGHFTPEQLMQLVEEQPPCECCPGGVHMAH